MEKLDGGAVREDERLFYEIDVEKIVPAKKHIKRKPIKYYINENGCHVCVSHSTLRGYPYIKLRYWGDRKSLTIIRFLWILRNGPLERKIFVIHRCDNPSCINMNHTWLGTPKENTQDMIKKGRRVMPRPCCGENRPQSKLTNKDIYEIRASSEPAKEVGLKYGITYSHVYKIKKLNVWKHLT